MSRSSRRLTLTSSSKLFVFLFQLICREPFSSAGEGGNALRVVTFDFKFSEIITAQHRSHVATEISIGFFSVKAIFMFEIYCARMDVGKCVRDGGRQAGFDCSNLLLGPSIDYIQRIFTEACCRRTNNE
jgi:hypothetical protein